MLDIYLYIVEYLIKIGNSPFFKKPVHSHEGFEYQNMKLGNI